MICLGADSDFLIFALSVAKNSVYSLHKTTTVQVIQLFDFILGHMDVIVH